MVSQQDNSYRLLWMLGLALTLPMILLSGPLAGYLISLLAIQRFDAPAFVKPLLMFLGLAGSGIQTYQLIKKLSQQRKND